MGNRLADINDTHLASLVGSRLCHDLINPIGAIGNGLELLELAQSCGGSSEEVGLIRNSVNAASARIRFYRVAFGKASQSGVLSARDTTSILRQLYTDNRFKVVWTSADEHTQAETKLAFLALTCIEHAMPWGGSVEINRAGDAWLLHATTTRLRNDARLWDLLSKGGDFNGLQENEVQFGFLAALLQRDRRPISVTFKERNLSLLI